jgi:hypothetical protein
VTDYVKVAGHDGLVRDLSSKAIVNMNRSGYQAYVNQRDVMLKRQQQLDENTQDIETIKSDISDIKEMLKILIQQR